MGHELALRWPGSFTAVNVGGQLTNLFDLRSAAGLTAFDDRAARAADRQVREEPEYYIPDLLFNEDYEPDPKLVEAGDAHSEDLRVAMASLDDAGNLTEVLMASVEQEGDSRAMQAEAVLKTVREKLRDAHIRIYRQDARHRNLFLAYFELKERAEAGGE